MDGRLTKTALKQELRRRIEWFQKSYPDITELDRWNYKDRNPVMIEECGRYWTYCLMLEQIENGYFVGGGVS